jgi:hypothetical protein
MGLHGKISGSGGLSPGRPTAGFATGRAGFWKAVVSDGTRRCLILPSKHQAGGEAATAASTWYEQHHGRSRYCLTRTTDADSMPAPAPLPAGVEYGSAPELRAGVRAGMRS